jgi:hypothetical protein
VRKFLVALVVIFAGIAVLVGIILVKGSIDQREGKRFADAALTKIASHWNEQALFDLASPELKKAYGREQFDSWFVQYRALGSMTSHSGSITEWRTFFNLPTFGFTTNAAYVAHADFEHGSAQITITIAKRNGSWRIFGFWVQLHLSESPARFAPRTLSSRAPGAIRLRTKPPRHLIHPSFRS